MSFANAGIIQTVINPTVYSSDTALMDISLGISSDYIIEDFEDTNLINGLQIAVTNSTTFRIVTGVAPADEKWDGDSALDNKVENPTPGADVGDVEFQFSSGLLRFGIGLGHLEQNTHVIVNGVVDLGDIRSFSNFVTAGPNRRNGYLWIDATDGDLISSVKFDGPNLSDTVFYDHMATLQPVPSPGSGIIFMLGLLGLRLVRIIHSPAS